MKLLKQDIKWRPKYAVLGLLFGLGIGLLLWYWRLNWSDGMSSGMVMNTVDNGLLFLGFISLLILQGPLHFVTVIDDSITNIAWFLVPAGIWWALVGALITDKIGRWVVIVPHLLWFGFFVWLISIIA